MAGGVGSRLYPISTPEKPKQFLDLLGVGKTLIQLTYERFLAVDPEAHFWVVTSEAYYKYIKEQLPSIPDEQILLEPVARNTAPCIAYVSWKIAQRYPDARVMVAPSDAYVPDVQAFAVTARQALEFVLPDPGGDVMPGADRASKTPDQVGGDVMPEVGGDVMPEVGGDVMPDSDRASGAIVTIGITPDNPCTEYGYIHVMPDSDRASKTPGRAGGDISKVSEFKEKPSMEVAERYLAEGGYFWNAGIFVYGVETMIAELRKFAPSIAALMDELAPSLYTRSEQSALADIFPRCEKISIDYAVMERSSLVYMAPSAWSWSDLGSFAAIEKVTGKKII